MISRSAMSKQKLLPRWQNGSRPSMSIYLMIAQAPWPYTEAKCMSTSVWFLSSYSWYSYHDHDTLHQTNCQTFWWTPQEYPNSSNSSSRTSLQRKQRCHQAARQTACSLSQLHHQVIIFDQMCITQHQYGHSLSHYESQATRWGWLEETHLPYQLSSRHHQNATHSLANHTSVIKWWVDGSHAIHPNMPQGANSTYSLTLSWIFLGDIAIHIPAFLFLICRQHFQFISVSEW